jgi:acetate CoA/acetoacetate CoA-transferase alpha subunit
MGKVIGVEQAVAKIRDGSSIMFGGFLGVGAPLCCIEKLVESGVKDLTVISVVSANPCGGFDLAPLFKNKQVKKFITAHAGTCPEAVELYKARELEIEFFPMGTWIEKIRAGGNGLGGVLTPIGVGTLVEQGKQVVNIAGKDYLLELPLRADFAFIKGFRADQLGNVEYHGVSINSNPVIAMAADYTIAEVNEIVAVGEIEPIRVGTPSIFVQGIVQGYTYPQQEKVFEDMWVRSGRLVAAS